LDSMGELNKFVMELKGFSRRFQANAEALKKERHIASWTLRDLLTDLSEILYKSAEYLERSGQRWVPNPYFEICLKCGEPKPEAGCEACGDHALCSRGELVLEELKP